MQTTRTKILVVDDEHEVTDTLRNFLSRHGHEVDCAYSAEEALYILERKEIPIILLDIRLPRIQGAELARIIKSKYPNSKIIIVTAYFSEGQGLYSSNLSEAFFVKPIGLNQLYSKLLEIINIKDKRLLLGGPGRGIKASILLISARLLFIEPLAERYNLLCRHFKDLSSKGENYQLDVVCDWKKVSAKLTEFQPDIVLANTSFFNHECNSTIFNMLDEELHIKETIIYNMAGNNQWESWELQRLAQSVKSVCLKHGLLEIKQVII